MRAWCRFVGRHPVDGHMPSYFGPLSHVRPGMLTFMEDPRHPGRLAENKQALVLCRQCDAEMVKMMGHDALSVESGTPRERFWRLFQASARAGHFEPAGCRIAESAKIQKGAEIGVPPFKVVEIDGLRQLARHVGGVDIGENVVIGTTSTVQSGIYGEFTEIGNDVFIDNRVHVGHGTRIGARTRIAAGAILGAWLEVGEDVWIGIGAMIREHVRIGNGAVIGMGAVVLSDVADGVTVVGSPARPLERPRTPASPTEGRAP